LTGGVIPDSEVDLRRLEAAIAHALLSITPDDAAHWFASCGYTIT